MSTVPACPANYTAPCVPCYIGASTAVYSFPYKLTTIEVEATPYLYPGRNGSTSTSWKYVTLTETLNYNSSGTVATGTSDGMTYSHPTGVTWTTRDLTLTYPTTYIEYHDFSGVGADIANATACAQAGGISQFNLASETVEMSFIMKWEPTASEALPYPGLATTLPPEILSYLDTIPAVTSQLGGQSIESCRPANAPPACTTPLTDQPGVCSSGCITGLPTSTMFYTNISTSVLPASRQTFTAYSWNSPSYRYSSHPETTVYSTSVSSTVFVNTKGNYTTVSCWETCVAAEESTKTRAASLGTRTLTTASVLTTINKDAIIATVPAGIADVTPTVPKSTPTDTSIVRPPARPVETPSPDVTTAKGTLPDEPQTRKVPTALPAQEPSNIEVDSETGLTSCTDALCALTAAFNPSPEPTQEPPLGDDTAPAPAGGTSGQQDDNSGQAAFGAVVTADSQTVSISVASGGDFVVGTKTVAPGGVLTLQNSQVISVDVSAIHLDGSAIPVSAIESAKPLVTNAVFIVGSQVFTALPVGGGSVAIGSVTIAQGHSLTLPNGRIVGVGASAIQVGSSEIAFSTFRGDEPTLFGVVFTNALGEVETATQVAPGVFVAGSTTVTAGQEISLSNGVVATVGPGEPLARSGNGAVFTAGDQTLTASAIRPGVFAIGTITLSAGQDITLSNGDVIHANSNGIQLGTSTLKFSALGAQTTGVVFYDIDHQTLTPGGVITEGSATISLDKSGQTYFVDGSPTPVSMGIVNVDGTKYTAHTAAGTTGVGDYVVGGISSSASRSKATAKKTGSGTEAAPSATSSSGAVQGFGASVSCVVALAVVAVVAVML